MSGPSTYQSLPDNYEEAQPLLDQALQQSASSIAQSVGSSKQPYPPRNLRELNFLSSGFVLIGWDLPVKSSDVAGFKVYVGNEFTPSFTIATATQLSQLIPWPGHAMVYVSCVNAQGVESQKPGFLVLSGGSGYGYSRDFQRYSRNIVR